MSAYLKQVLSDAPVGYWPLDETSGTVAYDRSGNGRNGTYGAAITLNAATSVIGTRCPSFPGTAAATNTIDLTDNDAWSITTTNALSVEAWVNPSGNNAYQVLIGKTNATTQADWYLYLYTGQKVDWQPTNNAGADGGLCESVSITATGRWYHVVGAINVSGGVGTSFLYVDGAQVATNSKTFTYSNSTEPARVAGYANGSAPLGGYLCHVAIYPTALSAARIKAHYEAGIRGGVMLG